jgi:hypothetical protein
VDIGVAESLRKGVRRLFNICRIDKKPESWELCRGSAEIKEGKRLPSMVAELSAVLLIIYIWWLDYIGLFLEAL